MTTHSKTQATWIGFIAILFWSTMPVVALFTEDVPPYLTLSVAYFSSFIAYLFYWKFKHESFLARIKQPISYVLLNIWGTVVAHSAFFYGMQLGDPVVSYIIINFWPIVALFFARLIFKEKLTLWHIAGSILGFAGVIFIAFKDGYRGLDTGYIIGSLLALANAIIWSSFSVLTRKFEKVPSDSFGLGIGISSVIAFILHFATSNDFYISQQELSSMLYLGILPFGLAYLFWGYGIKKGDIRNLMILGYGMPLFGVIWMVMLNYASFTWQLAVAVALIMVGAGLGSIKK